MMLAGSDEVEVGGGWMLRRWGKAARIGRLGSARVSNPYNAATYRPKLSRRIPSILCFPTLNNEKTHTHKIVIEDQSPKLRILQIVKSPGELKEQAL